MNDLEAKVKNVQDGMQISALDQFSTRIREKSSQIIWFSQNNTPSSKSICDFRLGRLSCNLVQIDARWTKSRTTK
jgi:hypothetical protein